MAFKKATVETFPALKETVEQLKAKYKVALEDLDPSRVIYLKSDGKSKKVVKISPIKVPHPSVTPFKFALTVFAQNFDELDEARQVLHVLRELRRIEDFEDSKVGNYPLQDFPDIVEKYGTLWEEREDLDNVLNEKK